LAGRFFGAAFARFAFLPLGGGGMFTRPRIASSNFISRLNWTGLEAGMTACYITPRRAVNLYTV
jgi:hypothetical protein